MSADRMRADRTVADRRSPDRTKADGGGADRTSTDGRPLGAYAGLAGVFAAGFGAVLVGASRTGRLPERIGAGDIALIALATHRVSRTLARDRVTSFVRAPFTRYVEPAEFNEVNEEPAGRGLRRSLGELLSCPSCTGQWVAAAFTAGLLLAPRPTRAVAAMFSAYAAAEFLHIGYAVALRSAS
jgi:hypothetical protein